MGTIPASELVNVSPSVQGAGGSAVDVIGLLLTDSARAPIGSVLNFPSGDAVASYFGAASAEARIASGGPGFGTGYFGGFANSTKKPSNMLVAQYNSIAVSAYLRGGNVSALTLAQLQAINGTLAVTVDGVTLTAPALDLAAATSFTAAAGIIETALDAAAPAGASVTGSIGGIVTASAGAAFTGTGSGTNLTVASIAGVLHAGAQLAGVGVPAGTYIVSQTSGSAGSNGVYVTNHATTSSGDAIVATSNVLDVTAVVSGTLQPTSVVSGSGVTLGTIVEAQLSGAPAGIGLYTIDSFEHFASTAVTSLSTILNVTAVGSGTLEVGALLAGTNVTTGSIITAEITGTGGIGTYQLSKASTTISETITTTAVTPDVSYDSVSGAFNIVSQTTGATSSMSVATGTTAASLKLTTATGAVLSQGAAAAVPAAFMNALIGVNQNWVTFFFSFDPDAGSGNDVKQAFAAWKNTKNNRFAYVCGDTDVTPTQGVPATSSLGYILNNNGDSGTCLNWEPSDQNLTAFVAGSAAAIDFTQRNGRISFAYKRQEGLVGGVTDPTIAANLYGNPQTADRGNGYNLYGAFANANQNFIWYQRGFVTGDFKWFDSYICQVWFNSLCQSALLNLQDNSLSIPYSTAGNTLIESALADPIQAALNFGLFGPAPLSSSQIADVNASAGANIASSLQTQGYYLQILPAVAASRAARTTPPAKLWYIDLGSVQAINLASVALL